MGHVTDTMIEYMKKHPEGITRRKTIHDLKISIGAFVAGLRNIGKFYFIKKDIIKGLEIRYYLIEARDKNVFKYPRPLVINGKTS